MSVTAPRITAPAAILILLLTSCGESSNTPATSAGSGGLLKRDGIAAIVLESEAEGSQEALIEGKLVLTENNCLALQQSDGTLEVVAGPVGTELLTGNSSGVRVPDVGDNISAGGGWNPPPDHWTPDITNRCPTTAGKDIAMIEPASSIDL